MTLRNRLTLSSTVLFAVTLGVVVSGLYLLFRQDTRAGYYHKLFEHANTAAYFYFEKDELNALRYREIRARFEKIESESIWIYHAGDKAIYTAGGRQPDLSNQVLERIVREQAVTFAKGPIQFAGILYKDNQGDFIVVCSGVDGEGRAGLVRLSWLLLGSCIAGIAIHYWLAGFLSTRTFSPFANLLKNVRSIGAENLHSRLDIPAGKNDELKELILTFNDFLHRLENSIELQKGFLRNASHELKTPLTAIIGDLDVALTSRRSNDEYVGLLNAVKGDAIHFKAVLENLLILSGLGNEGAWTRKITRIDEVLWDVLEKKRIEYPGCEVAVDLEDLNDREDAFNVSGNRDMLFIALANIVDNAIKFSLPKPVMIRMGMEEGRLVLTIADRGPGIPESEHSFVFDTFYRSNSTRHVKGQGLGLAITQKILQMHGIMPVLESSAEGTRFLLVFPKT